MENIDKTNENDNSMEIRFQLPRQDLRASRHFERPRLNELFMEAVRYPLVVICAGTGYGKTSAVLDFIREYEAIALWVQFSERDNVSVRFWESYTHTIAVFNTPFAAALEKLGFPDTVDKLNQYQALLNKFVALEKRIIVLDDYHIIENPQVIQFVDRVIHNMPVGTSVFLISRSSPGVNFAGLFSKGSMYSISEDDLRFTDDELAQYFRRQEIFLQPDNLREIMQDTEGWAFAINLIARSYQKAPGYVGYLRSAMKTNIFRLMETEIWNLISDRVQNFLVRLSLIDHLSFELIGLLAGGDEELIAALEKQNAYVRRDNYINAYVIQSLFLEFLATKQESLPAEQKRETYTIAGNWCAKNGFTIDALSYFEKTGNYTSIVSVLMAQPSQIPHEIAKFAAEILDRAPDEMFDTVELLAIMHLSTYMCQGLWKKSEDLAEFYEKKFLKLPEGSSFRNWALSVLYHCWGLLRVVMCTKNDQYDFDIYFEKSCQYLSEKVDLVKFSNHSLGPWVNAAGSSRKGAPEEFIEALSRTTAILSKYFNGLKTGEDELVRGELKFYQGDLRAAETFIIRALEQAREYSQFEVIHRALCFTLRLSVVQGDFPKAEQVIKEIKSQLDDNQYINRYINYDIALSWYYCILGMPEKIPDWLKENFSPYGHASFIENFGNLGKAVYHYLTRNYPPLLSYIQELRQRESYLFGRVEMLAMEACIHYRTKDKQRAFAVLSEAYETAAPNDIIMPFIELGKDMRTLTSSAIKESDGAIPRAWLETINRKAASYAKRQAHMLTKYSQTNHMAGRVALSPRETEVLADLSHGLSRAEIAANRNLSINTVKMVINNVYSKLGARNIADLIRIAVERKMI